MARLAIILIAVALTLGVWSLGSIPRTCSECPEANRKESGPYPAEWFMQQRMWPDAAISSADYLAAAEQAERLAERALDDPPVWIQAGPANIGGRVTDIVGHPTDAQRFYVGSASGGVFKTVDGGATWAAIFDEQPTQSIGALAIDLARPDTLYVGTGEANSAGFSYFGTGLYRTRDGGGSWEPLGLEQTRYISRVLIDRQNPANLFVAALGELYLPSEQRGVFHSPDAGATWTRVLHVNDSTGASDLVMHPEDSQILYAATWQRLRSPERRMVGGPGSGIYRTTNGGQEWTRLQDGLPQPAANVGRIGLAISRSHPNVLYAIYADDPGYFFGIYKTVDGGDTWGRVNDDDLSGMYANFGWYFGNIRVRPDNPDVVFALGQILMRSMDGGQNWAEIGADVHVDHHALWFHPAQPTRLLLGCDGGAYLSTNNGNSWSFRSGLHNNQFYAATIDPSHPERRYGGTQDQGTLRTLTGAVDDWTSIHGGDGFYVAVDPTNAERIYAEYQWGGLERSDDDGVSWDYKTDGIDPSERRNWSTPVVMMPDQPPVLFYGAERLYRTTNRGDSWTAFSPDLTDGGGAGNLTFGTITTIGLRAGTVFVGTDDANVWVSTNGGANWSNRSPGLPDRWVTRANAYSSQVPGLCFVTVSGFRNAEADAHLFRSYDFGAHWSPVGTELPAGPLNDFEFDGTVPGRMYVASDFGVYVSPDFGDHWHALGEGLPRVPVIDLVLHSQTLTAATYGRSMFRADLATLDLNRMPFIASVSPPLTLDSVDAGTALTFATFATDPDGEAVSYRWFRDGSLIGSADSVQVDFSEADQTVTLGVEVTDGELTDRRFWSIDVSGTAVREPAPVTQSPLLLSSYPNPFNSDATVRYVLPTPGAVRLDLFDVSGRRVRGLLDAVATAGEHRFRLAAGDLPSGTYFLRLHTPRGARHEKLLLLK